MINFAQVSVIVLQIKYSLSEKLSCKQNKKIYWKNQGTTFKNLLHNPQLLGIWKHYDCLFYLFVNEAQYRFVVPNLVL